MLVRKRIGLLIGIAHLSDFRGTTKGDNIAILQLLALVLLQLSIIDITAVKVCSMLRSLRDSFQLERHS